jgi:hypothetical protein
MAIERQTIFDAQVVIFAQPPDREALQERHRALQSIGQTRRTFLSRSVREIEPKVTRTPVDVHATFSKDVPTDQNVVGREVVEHGKVTDELNPVLESK